jgi:RND family efflux transporter MFP subunit
VDPTTGTIVVRATFDNVDERLWPGQLCDLSLTIRVEPNTVVVPREAIQIGQNGNYVFTIADGVAHVRPIEAGRTANNETVITKGLDGGENVVVDGALLLIEGSKVEVRNAPKGAS